ncbi:MAG: serine hydrolase [Terriglobales bacterium]
MNVNALITSTITLEQQAVYHVGVGRQKSILNRLGWAAFLAALVLVEIAAGQAPNEAVHASGVEAKINRIMNGLLPGAIIKGQPTPRMTLADRMDYYKVPQVSIAVLDHGQIAWARGYGLADKEANDPVTPETLFQAASVSKSVTALAALRLVQQGKLNLDEDVNLKLVSWKVPDNEFTKNEKVTLRRLLSHTAGMTVPSVSGYRAGEYMPTTVQILNGEKTSNEPVRVDRVPGKEFRYSGGGYVVVQLLLMDVTGKSFPALMHDLIFEPLGMTHSTFEAPLPKGLWPEVAQPYDRARNDWFSYSAMAPAGLWTTPSDLLRFTIEIEKAYAGESKLLSQALAHEMLAYQSNEIYGLGVALGQRGHAVRFWHSGSNGGYQCLFEGFPQTGKGLAIMTDGAGGLQLIGEIQRAVAQEYDWPDDRMEEHTLVEIDPSVLRAFTGVYLFGGLFKFIITQDDGNLYVQYGPFGDNPQELFAESDTRFFMTSRPVVINFRKESDGSIKKARVRNGAEELDGERISDPHPLPLPPPRK